MEFALGQLTGLQNIVTKDFLSNLGMKIEGVASDYMGQAEELLGHGVKGSYDHAPAAVLAGGIFFL